MPATILDIQHKERPNPAAWVRISDFTTAVAGTIDSAAVMQSPHISLYCLDSDEERFIFVETPPDVDLSHHPFFFQAQFEHAQRLIAVPYDEMHALADAVQTDGAELILLYSVGRCGSTLLSEVFNQPENVVSLSEPDVFTHLLSMREPDGSQDEAIKRLLRTSMVALMKPLWPKRPSAWAIKFRSYAVELADLIDALFPAAKKLFMYRNAEDWARSTARAFQKLESERGSVGTAVERSWAQRVARINGLTERLFGDTPPPPLRQVVQRLDVRAGPLQTRAIQLRTRLFPALLAYEERLRQGDLSRMEYITLEWVSGMARYLALRQQGVRLLAFRYEELVAQPETMLHEIYDYCGWPRTAVAAALPIFAHDSQRGTSLARTAVRGDKANKITDTHLAQLRRIISQFPDLQTPHVILPGTIGVATGHTAP